MEHSLDDLVNIFFEKSHNKEPNQVSSLVAVAFSNPHILLDKLSQLKIENEAGNSSGINPKLVFKMYENISAMELDNQVIFHINKVFDKLATEEELNAFLKSSHEIKFFFVLILWRKLFIQPTYQSTLLRTLELIKRGDYYRNIFVECLGDIELDFFKQMVEFLNAILGKTVHILLEDPSEENHKHCSFQIDLLCNMLRNLYLSNKDKPRVPIEVFNNLTIIDQIDPVEQFKLYLKKSSQLNFINYPFLLGFDYKYKLIQLQSVYEQKMNIRKKIENGFSSILNEVDLNQHFSIEGLIFLYFNVNRHRILDDSMQKLGKIKENLKSPLKISFIGQEGADQGGVKNEYFQSVVKAIFNPYLDMFLPKNNSRFYWFNSHSFEPPIRFQFVGMILGLSLYNSVHLDIHFPSITYKKLLLKNFEDEPSIEMIEDLKEIEPDIYRTLKDILTSSEDVAELELYFVIEISSFGQRYLEELVQDGESIKLTNDNKQYYCMLYADYLLNKSISKQFAAFKRGFYRVVSGGVIQTFEPEQLSRLIGGIQEIDMKQLEANTSYEGGYTQETPVVKNFWDIMHTLNHEEKKNFLTFVTGTDRVPIDGLQSLNFLIQRHGDSSKLPSAHTCFNVFLLPEYQSRQILEKKLRIILEHNQGFGLI